MCEIVSLLYSNESGASGELAVIGHEGIVGTGVLLGARTASEQAVVQAAGGAYRLPAAAARSKFAEGGPFHSTALRFAHALMLQIAQTAICNLHHSVEHQLCRWLLLCVDRIGSSEIPMTHEWLATMLGVRRQGITEAAMRLQKRGIIRYFRGRIRVVDREGLERSACECYAVVKRETELAFSS